MRLVPSGPSRPPFWPSYESCVIAAGEDLVESWLEKYLDYYVVLADSNLLSMLARLSCEGAVHPSSKITSFGLDPYNAPSCS